MEGIETNDDPNDAPNDAINDPPNDDLAVDQSESTKTGPGEVLHSAATSGANDRSLDCLYKCLCVLSSPFELDTAIEELGRISQSCQACI